MLGRDIREYNFEGKSNIKETWMDLLHPEDRNIAIANFENHLNHPDGMYEHQFRMLHADGHYVWIWSRGRTVLDDDGTPTPITVGTHIDITERKQQEENLQRSHEELQTAYDVIARTGEDLRANLDKLTVQEQVLRESEEKFRTFFESAGDAIIILDGGIMYDCNHQAEILFRVPKSRLIGRSPADFAPALQPDGVTSRDLAALKIQESQGGNLQTFEYVHQYPDGTEFYTEITLQRIRMQGRWFEQAIVRDISERKLAEMERLRKNEELATAYEEILSAEAESRANQELLIKKDLDLEITKSQLDDIISFLPDATFVINQDGVVIAWNRAMEEMTGIAADQILGKGNFEYAIPFYHERRPILIDLALSGDMSIAKKYPVITRDGDFVTSEINIPHFYHGTGAYLWFTACPFYDPEGNVTGAIECLRDVTDRKKIELALEKHLVALTRPLEDTSVSFDELFDLREIQKIQDEFAEATGVASIITHPDGTPITHPSRFTHLCSDIIRKTERGCENCFRSDAILGSPHHDGPVVQPCMSGGLWDAGASIVLGNRHIANWLIGQVRDETQTEDAMRGYAREIGADEEDVVAAFHDVPSMPSSQFKSIAQYLYTLANHLSQSAYQNVQQARFIVERRKIDEKLAASESEHRNVIQNSPVGYHIYRLNEEGHLVFSSFNPAADSILHTAHESLVGREILDAFPGLTGTGIPEMYMAVAKGELEAQNFEAPYDRDGICGTYEVRVFQGAPGLAVVNFIDISERKRTEDQLRSSYEQIAATEEELRHQYEELSITQAKMQQNQQLLEHITEAIPGVVYQFYADPDGSMGLNYVSNRAHEVFGISNTTEDFFERFSQHVDLRDKASFIRSIQIAIESGTTWSYKGRFVKPSGENIWFQGISRPVKRGSELVFNGILLDISDRKSDRDKELFDRSLIRAITDAAKDGIIMLDPKGNISFWNHAAEQIFEYGKDEVIGRNLHDLLAPEQYHAAHLEAFGQFQCSGTGTAIGKTIELTALTKGGREIIIELSLSAVSLTDGWHSVGLVRDITARKSIDLALIIANKKLNLLSSITRHDINNQLTVIRGYSYLLTEIISDPSISESLQSIIRAAKQIEEMIHFTREYEEVGLITPVWHDCRVVIESAVHQACLSAVTVHNDLQPGLQVFADPLIVRVWYNLLDNALRYGEKISTIRFFCQQEDDKLVIICEDDGQGIPDDEKELIFDHGFGNNTGQGLFLAKEILDITNISIWETGVPGRGARFEIIVPKEVWRLHEGEMS